MAERRVGKKGDLGIVLRRKPKKRYLLIMHAGRDVDVLDSLARRCTELFGHLTTERAALRLMRAGDGFAVIRCRLGSLHAILVCVAMADAQMVTLGTSGSVRRLQNAQLKAVLQKGGPENA